MKNIIFTIVLLTSCFTCAERNPIIGHWKLISVLQNGSNISNGEELKDFRVFQDDSVVEFYNAMTGTAQSTYTYDNNLITIKSTDWNQDGKFKVIQIDGTTMEWEFEWMGTMTYKLKKTN